MTFEILLSTMYRTDLGFLDTIFKYNPLSNYNVLIINQTEPNKLLKSKDPNIRVFNSFERGTSASRNLAIKNAKGDICLFADDDTTFKPNFNQIIISAFKQYTEAYLLSFETVSQEGIPHLEYPKKGLHNKKTLKTVHMTGMAIRREKLVAANIFFNAYFSLGGLFSGGTEYIFLRDAYAKNLKAYHISKAIVEHDEVSSGKAIACDRVLHTNSARINHFHGSIKSRLYLFKYLFFLIRKKMITFSEIKQKYCVGLKGITDYEDLLKKGLIKRQL